MDANLALSASQNKPFLFTSSLSKEMYYNTGILPDIYMQMHSPLYLYQHLQLLVSGSV